MSYTTMYRIGSDGRPAEWREFRNSWGCGAFVWSALAGRYLDGEHAWMMTGGFERMSALLDDQRLGRYERAALAWTWDRAAIQRERAGDLAADLRAFAGRYGQDPAVVCHLPTVALALDELAADVDAMGACWNHTSVSSPVWLTGYAFDPESDDPNEPGEWSGDAVYYNFAEADSHFWIYDHPALAATIPAVPS